MSSLAPPKMAAVAALAPRPYRRFIIPSMHRRFTNAAVLSVGLCFAEGLWMSPYSSLWSVLGSTIIRTILLFISILAIYVLRVSNMHVGLRTSSSEFAIFSQNVVTLTAIRSLLWYLFSAWFFCEVYMWSQPATANLAIVDPGEKSYDRPRLNERPIFLRTMFMSLAVAQCLTHLYQDYDRIPIPVRKLEGDIAELTKRNQQPFLGALAELRRKALILVHRSVFRTLVTTIVAPFFYWLFIRQRVWHWTFWLTKQIFNLPKSSKVPVLPPRIIDLLGRFVVEGVLLVFAWEVANTTFDLFLAQEPMKQGRLLTEESPDPNGSLLNGLKVNRQVPRSFAFWELVLIAQSIPARRLSIYKDIDRPGGSAWSQVLMVSLGELHAIVRRIQESQQKSAPNSAQAGANQPTHDLPKIAPPIKQDNVFRPARPIPFSAMRGQSPTAPNIVEQSATKAIEFASHHTGQHPSISKDSASGFIQSLLIQFLRTPIGATFRKTFARCAGAVVLGTPHSSLSVILDAIVAVSRLAVYSKKEDPYGTVYRDVPNLVRTFTSTHTTIENFLQTLPVPSTDVEFKDSDRKIKDVELVLQQLRDGLRDVVNEFGEFADDLGLSPRELRAAKEVVARGDGKREEVRQVKSRKV